MDETIRDVYTLMIHLKDDGRLNAGSVYDYIDYSDDELRDSSWISYRSKFIRKYFNSKQDGFNLYLG